MGKVLTTGSWFCDYCGIVYRYASVLTEEEAPSEWRMKEGKHRCKRFCGG